MLPKVTNICGSFNCGCELDLCSIYFINTFNIPLKYVPCNFPGLRATLSQSTALIFSNGHIGIVGAHSIENFLNSVKEIINLLIQHDYTPIIYNMEINNICGALTLPPIDLVKLTNNNSIIASYETELFPALKYNLNGKIFTIHHTGKIFATGFTSIQEMNIGFIEIINIVKHFIKNKFIKRV
jgi:TATA-box binding protein (TBP) (component of TFIID and TFIIIB)